MSLSCWSSGNVVRQRPRRETHSRASFHYHHGLSQHSYQRFGVQSFYWRQKMDILQRPRGRVTQTQHGGCVFSLNPLLNGIIDIKPPLFLPSSGQSTTCVFPVSINATVRGGVQDYHVMYYPWLFGATASIHHLVAQSRHRLANSSQ